MSLQYTTVFFYPISRCHCCIWFFILISLASLSFDNHTVLPCCSSLTGTHGQSTPCIGHMAAPRLSFLCLNTTPCHWHPLLTMPHFVFFFGTSILSTTRGVCRRDLIFSCGGPQLSNLFLIAAKLNPENALVVHAIFYSHFQNRGKNVKH